MHIDNSFNIRIKSLRKKLNMRQKEFASRLGISQGYLSELEKGSKQPSDTLLFLLSNLFAINIDWLVTGEGESDSRKISEDPADYTGIPASDIPKEKIKRWIDAFWINASDKERGWFEIEFQRAFPECKEWPAKSCTSEVAPGRHKKIQKRF